MDGVIERDPNTLQAGDLRVRVPLAPVTVMSRDTVSRCIETSLHLVVVFGSPGLDGGVVLAGVLRVGYGVAYGQH